MILWICALFLLYSFLREEQREWIILFSKRKYSKGKMTWTSIDIRILFLFRESSVVIRRWRDSSVGRRRLPLPPLSMKWHNEWTCAFRILMPASSPWITNSCNTKSSSPWLGWDIQCDSDHFLLTCSSRPLQLRRESKKRLYECWNRKKCTKVNVFSLPLSLPSFNNPSPPDKETS